MMPNLGGWEWVILAVVALVLFGGSRLAGFGKSAGRAIREFKHETSALTGELAGSGPALNPAADGTGPTPADARRPDAHTEA